jgi:hypothetical protein
MISCPLYFIFLSPYHSFIFRIFPIHSYSLPFRMRTAPALAAVELACARPTTSRHRGVGLRMGPRSPGESDRAPARPSSPWRRRPPRPVCELPPLTSLIPQLDRLKGHRPRLDADEHKVQSFRRVSAAITVTVVLAHVHICRFAHASPGEVGSPRVHRSLRQHRKRSPDAVQPQQWHIVPGVRRGHCREPPAQPAQHRPPPRHLLLPLFLEQRADLLLQNKAYMGEETQVAAGGLSPRGS